MAYMGTLVVYGHGLAVVTSTAMATELGHIARSLQTVRPQPTPLQRRLAQLGRTLAIVSLVIVAVVFSLGIMAGEDWDLMLMAALSLAVAIVPEGLPAVATVALAIGARRMFQRQALIRKLPAVETLGSVTVICSDKTGTLTENQMTVTVLDVAGDCIDLTESKRRTDSGQETANLESFTSHSSSALLLAGAGLCNDAELLPESDSETGEGSAFQALGEPTEVALVLAGARMGLAKPGLVKWFPRMGEIPFDSHRKRMTTVHDIQAGSDGQNHAVIERQLQAVLAPLDGAVRVAFMKGAVSLAMAYWCWRGGAVADAHWRTIVFTVLTLSQMGNALAIRSDHDSLFRIGIFSNKAMLGSVLLTFLLQMGVIYFPPLQAVFKTVALSIGELLSCLLLSTVVFWAIEWKKWFARGGSGRR